MERFPTEFALRIAKQVGLIPITMSYEIEDFGDEADKRRAKAELLEESLRDFQKMAVFCDYDDCAEIYDFITLSEKQENSLRAIHRMTLPWVKGEMAGLLLKNAYDAEPKEISAIVKEVMGQNLSSGDFPMEAASMLKINLNPSSKDEDEEAA